MCERSKANSSCLLFRRDSILFAAICAIIVSYSSFVMMAGTTIGNSVHCSFGSLIMFLPTRLTLLTQTSPILISFSAIRLTVEGVQQGESLTGFLGGGTPSELSSRTTLWRELPEINSSRICFLTSKGLHSLPVGSM